MEPLEVFYDKFSKSYGEALKFMVIQNPIATIVGIAVGFSLTGIFTKITASIVKPVVHAFFKQFIRGKIESIQLVQTLESIVEELLIFAIFIYILYYLLIVPFSKLRKSYGLDNAVMCQYCRSMINPCATKCPNCTADITQSSTCAFTTSSGSS
jgi:large-conductance mechanosensitive channel